MPISYRHSCGCWYQPWTLLGSRAKSGGAGAGYSTANSRSHSHCILGRSFTRRSKLGTISSILKCRFATSTAAIPGSPRSGQTRTCGFASS